MGSTQASTSGGKMSKSESFFFVVLAIGLPLVAYTQWQLYVEAFHWYEGVAISWPKGSFKGPRLSVAGLFLLFN
jgi:hypothetical protein